MRLFLIILLLVAFLGIGVGELAFATGISKEDLRAYLEGADSLTASQKISEIVRESPGLLEAVLLWKDPKNHYGRWNGLIHWFELAGHESIGLDRYFDVLVQLLARAKEDYLPSFAEEERQNLKKHITFWGCKPYKPTPVYKGIHSSIRFFIICLKIMGKYGLIRTRSTIDTAVNQLEFAESALIENDLKNKAVATQKLRELLGYLVQKKDDFTVDSLEVTTSFAKNILSQLEK